MRRNDKGFEFPVVSETCVECRLCEGVCPVILGSTLPENKNQHAFAGIAKDKFTWVSSSSGGAFSCISETFGRLSGALDQTVVFGAAFDFPRVIHVSRKVTDMVDLRKSKYVQSSVGTSMIEAKALLAGGRPVVFSGTPCQIAGLKKYLGKDYDNLLTLDFICHGVGSPMVFEKCIELEETEQGKEVLGYTFRYKKSFAGNYERYLSRFDYADGSSKLEGPDRYNRLFLNQLCLRDCCGESCMYRNENRVSDITLADLNGKANVLPEVSDSRPFSCFVTNTKKGEAVCRHLDSIMVLYEISLDDVKKYNPLFYKTTPENPQREFFFKRFVEGENLIKLSDEFAPKKKNIKMSVMSLIPWKFKHAIKVALNIVQSR